MVNVPAPNIVKQTVPSLPTGATSIYDAGYIKSSQNANALNKLTNSVGGNRRKKIRKLKTNKTKKGYKKKIKTTKKGYKKKIKTTKKGYKKKIKTTKKYKPNNNRKTGGKFIVPAPPSYAPNLNTTQNNYTNLTKLATTQAAQAELDKT
jgi:hypothetical protein